MAVRQKSYPIEEKAGEPVRSDRSFAQYVLLSFLTFSVYHYIFLDSWVKDINQLCKEDGERTASVGEMILFSLLTFGIYKYLWIARLVDRIYNNASRYDVDVRQDGNGFFLWVILVPVVGYFIAMYIAIRDTNRLAASSQQRQEKKKCRNSEILRIRKAGFLGISGMYAGKKIYFDANQPVVLGRDPVMAQLIFSENSENISRCHCRILYDEKRSVYRLKDTSKNGTYLSGKRLPSNMEILLDPGTEIDLGNEKNRIRLL